MIDASHIMARLQRVMHKVFGRSDFTITRSTMAPDIVEWDSLSHVRLILAVEKEFRVRFTQLEIEHLDHVGALVDLVAAKQGR